MKNATSPTVRTLVMAAGIAAAQHSVAFVAGDPVAESTSVQSRSAEMKATLDQVQSLLAVSKVVKAKEILGTLRASDAGVMSSADSSRYQNLLRSVTEREKALDKHELSVQKAEVALESGELGLAEQHARAVATAKSASPVLQKQADELLSKVDTRREAVKATAPKAIRAAANAFDMGKYVQAKDLLDSIAKAGVELDASDAAMMDEYRGRIVALAEARSDLFAGPSAGMVQPGEIQPRRPEEAEPLEATPSRPSSEPAPVSEPAPAAEPAPSPAPAETMAMAQPAATPAPAPAQPPAEDPVVSARRNEAARELSRADELFANRKFAEASSAYTNVRSNYGDVLTAEQNNALGTNLAAAQQALASMVSPAAGPAGGGQSGGGLANFQESTAVAKQQALAEFNNFLMESKRSLDKGDVEVARQNAARAELVLDSRKALFSEPELLDLRGRVNGQKAEIQKKGDAIQAAEAAERDARLQSDAKSRSDSEKAAKAQKIRENIDRVRSLQASRKYAEGLQVVDEILFLDPLNPTGLLLRDVLRDMKLYAELGQIDENKSRSYDILAVQSIEAATAPSETVAYPKEWPNISGLRSEALAFQDTPDNRRVIAALDSTRIPKAELADTPLEASLKYLQTFANVNMDVDWASLESIGVQKDTTVSLNLTNPTVKTVLDQVLSKVSPSTDVTSMAGWTVYDGVLHIGSEVSLRRNKVMVIYDVQDLLFEIVDKVNVPELDLQAAFQNTGGGGGGGGGGGSPFGGQGQQQRQPGQGLQRPFEERIRDLRTIIVEQVDRGGWAESGGDEDATIQVFQQNLIVTHTPKVHRSIEGLLSQLRRVRNMQINVEARFLVVSSDFFEQIGFDVDLYLNARSNQVRFLRQFNYAFMPSEFFPQGTYVGNNVTSGNRVVDGNQDGIPDAPLAGGGPAASIPENFSVVGITNGSLPLTSRLMTSAFANEVTGSGTASPALGISGTFLDDVQVDFLLQATQADRRAVSLNAPRLTFTNGQTANVFVARQIGYIADLEAQVNEGGVAYDPQPGFVNDGVTLLVGGVILADRRYVQLDVETRVSNFPLEDFRRVPVTAATTGGGGVIGGGSGRTIEAFFELPQGQIQSVSTTVTVPDQGTVLLGGQRLTQEIEVESGVPVLSKIPFINRFFNNRSMSREERTLLMLIRPQILIQNETEDKFFPGLREAIRTGGFGS
jgi:Flp pilus assembly secretin CpaC